MERSPNEFTHRAGFQSFIYAFKGLALTIRYEPNARIHIAAGILAVILGMLFRINLLEWALIIICIGSVITAEIINTAIERLADIISIQKNEKIGEVKDISAGAVLVTALVALTTGSIIFLPYIIHAVMRIF